MKKTELVMHSYCGMRTVLHRGTTEECLQKAEALRKIHSEGGGEVSELGELQWELETPDDAVMVSDMDGILTVMLPEEQEDDDDL